MGEKVEFNFDVNKCIYYLKKKKNLLIILF